MNNTIHFIKQGKGGIGKSLVATLLAQYFRSKTDQVSCFDTDQVNTTFAHYKALNVEHIPVMNDSLNIDAKRFDSLVEKLLSIEGVAVIDNGANTFAPLLAYMVENEVIDFLQENGKKVYIHTIVGGGDVLGDTMNGFNSVANCLPNTNLVLWMNEHFGQLVTPDGKPFVDTKIYQGHKGKGRLVGEVTLAARNRQTYGDDILRMNKERLTIEEVMASDRFSIMEKQRIRTVARDVFSQLDAIDF